MNDFETNLFDGSQKGTTTGQSETRSNGNEEVPHIPS